MARDDFDDSDDASPRRRPAKKGMSGTTLTLIVLAVLAVPCLGAGALFALLMPAVSKVREAATRARDSNNMKRLGLGMHSREAATDAFIAPFAVDDKGTVHPGNSFRVSLVPYLENGRDLDFDLTQRWDSPRNKPASDTVIPEFASPVDGPPTVNTPYRAFVGGGAMFDASGKPVKVADIKDGLSNTIMLVHADTTVPWAEPNELTYSPTAPLPPLGNRFPGGFHVLMGDGSVRFVKKTVSEATLRSAITRAGGEPPPDL